MLYPAAKLVSTTLKAGLMAKGACWHHAQGNAFVSPDSSKKLKDVLEEFHGDGILSRYNPEQVRPCPLQPPPPPLLAAPTPPLSPPAQLPQLEAAGRRQVCPSVCPPAAPRTCPPRTGRDAPTDGELPPQPHPRDQACGAAVPPHPTDAAGPLRLRCHPVLAAGGLAESDLGHFLARQRPGGIYSLFPPK